MELFDEIDEFHQLLMKETSAKLDCDLEGFQDLETKYANLHDSYTKEIENSKKVEKCLLKCLKFYSKLSKKYEAQQKIIIALEENIKEKVHSLEESLRTQEKLRGVIDIYRTERSVYTGMTFESLMKDKQLLLDICIKLIGEAPETDNVRSLGNLILKKFKKDLDDKKIVKLLKLRHIPLKNETNQEFPFEDVKPPRFTEVKSEDNVKEEKSLDNTCSPISIEEKPKTEKELNNCIESCKESNLSAKDNIESDDEDDDLVSVEENEIDLSLHLLNISLISNDFLKEKQEEEKINISHLGSNKKENSLEIGETDFEIKESNSQLGEADFLKETKNKKEGNDCIKEKVRFLNVTTYSSKKQRIGNSEKSGENFSAKEKILHSNEGALGHKSQITELSVENVANLKNFNSKICDDGYNKEEQKRESNFGSNESPKRKTSKTLSNSSISNSSTVAINSEHQKQLVFKESIFDVPEININNKKNNSISSEQFLLEFDTPIEKEKNHSQENIFSNLIHEDLNCDTNSIELNEEDLCKIFRETSNVRLLSPIKELTVLDKNVCSNKKIETFVKTKSEIGSEWKRKRKLSSSSAVSEPTTKSKKVKSTENQTGFLDSIMSAMSQQNEEFRTIKKSVVDGKPEIENKEASVVIPEKSSPPVTRSTSLVKKSSKEDSFVQKPPRKENDKLLEKTVVDELKKFVSVSISSKEEADRNVKQCVSVLRNKSEQIVARSIVSIVFENVDENVELFERPAPPLTKTQHRLIVLLSVFKTLDPDSEKISSHILNLIWEKLYPDKFFWPDDCVETATRFYTALCRSQNDVKTLWKFCLEAMTEMKQRCSLVVFTALKTWPDVLHNASTLQNNILASTIVNIFLHMPKTEGLRNVNQKKKLFALKHLLMNFYQFKVDETIESYTQKVFEAFWENETGSEKSLVLLAKCRDWNWTNKNILIKLKKKLKDWSEEKLEDCKGIKVLSVTKQICSVLLSEGENAAGQAKEIVSCLSEALNSGRLNHLLEQNIIQLLLQFKQYAEARAVIREWKPKEAISESLRNEIIDVSAENILRELKLNKKKVGFERKKSSKLKRSKKKSKNKKKKEKKKNNRQSNVGCIAEL